MDIRNIKEEQIIEAIRSHTSLKKSIESLGLSGTQNQYKFFRDVIKRCGVDISHHVGLSNKNTYDKWVDKLKDVDQSLVDKCDCLVDIAEMVGLHKKGTVLKSGYYAIIKSHIEQENINIDHFTFSKGGNSTRRYTEEEIFCKNGNVTKQTLKKRYLKYRETLDIPYECDIIDCNLSHWQHKLLNLQLDHVNGINNDNRIENLRLLCPNCHSQTDTFAGRRVK